MSLFGIILGLVGLMTACMKGLSIIIAAPFFAIIVGIFGGLPILDTFLDTFMSGAVGFIANMFPIFLFGAIFGKVMESTGAAASVGNWVIDKIGAKNAIIAIAIACGILTYGGISVFVVVFTMYPLTMGIFKEADIPRRLIPGSIVLGGFTFTMTAFPGTPQIHNIIPTRYLGTDPMAAPTIGIIAGILMFISGVWYMNREVQKAKDNGEHFHPIDTEDTTKYEEIDESELPNFAFSILPLISVIVLLNIVGMNINASLFWGIVLAIVLNFNKLDGITDLKNIFNNGASGAIPAAMNTSLAVGFGTVVRAVPGFDTMVDGLSKVTFGNAYINAALSTNLIAGATGSATGGLSIALEALGESFVAMGGNPEILHRVVALSAGGLDVLPHNGAIITVLIVTGMTHEDSYKDIFVVALVIPIIVTIVSVALASLGIK